ncbi:molecular chaperone TorD family protein [Sedimenticola selenatireducens]|uniref:molecular chaperone TorD family protein n=1 Tax=Sedimenticola selenatireducens TaxID=191960 RepID=UPI002AAB3F4A|nr:molecular chaperone TorD family protein [Sedimenticola selenatireducens]
MNESVIEQDEGRASMYGMMALGFTYPDTGLHEYWRGGGFVKDLGIAVDKAAPEILEKFQTTIASSLKMTVNYEEFEALYLSAFETDLPKRSVSLYEGSYVRGGGKSDLLLELKDFYSNFGLEVSEELHELEDRITAELEFMQFLTLKQCQKGIDKKPYIMAQHDFLERHLAPWMPHLQKEVRKRNIGTFYIGLTDLMVEFIETDMAYLRQINADTDTTISVQ